MVTSSILKIKSSEHIPRKNFGNAASRRRGESNFLKDFEKAFFARAKQGIAIDEFSVAQHGIADLLWIGWRHEGSEEFSALALHKMMQRRHLYAFEAKLTDWQKALQQAYRYRYYADKAIVLMPLENSQTAVQHLGAFREAKVGLWSFDKKTGKIREFYTPTKVRALNQKSRVKAIDKLAKTLKLR